MIEFEKRRMEYGMNPALIRELDPICRLVLLQDLERTEPVWCEFWKTNVFEGICESGFVDEDLVSNFEGLKVS